MLPSLSLFPPYPVTPCFLFEILSYWNNLWFFFFLVGIPSYDDTEGLEGFHILRRDFHPERLFCLCRRGTHTLRRGQLRIPGRVQSLAICRRRGRRGCEKSDGHYQYRICHFRSWPICMVSLLFFFAYWWIRIPEMTIRNLKPRTILRRQRIKGDDGLHRPQLRRQDAGRQWYPRTRLVFSKSHAKPRSPGNVPTTSSCSLEHNTRNVTVTFFNFTPAF